MIVPVTEERLEQVQRLLREDEAAAAPEPINAGNALAAGGDGDVLEYRGRRWHVRPLSGEAGLRLTHLAAQVGAAATETAAPGVQFARVTGAYRQLVRELGRMARPVGWRGWLWSLRPNPFRNATGAEVQALVRGFARLQTSTSVRFR